MNVFAVLSAPTEEIPLTEARYNNATRRSAPYVQNRNGEVRCYAICPECQNPTLLVNRGVSTTDSKILYAKHVDYSVPGLADYNQDAYEDCQLANPHRFDSKTRRKSGEKTNKIKGMFIKYIDVVISSLEQAINIKLSDHTIDSMIADFCGNKGYEYRAVSVRNLPLAFLFMTEAKNLSGCSVSVDIANEINKNSRNFEAPVINGFSKFFIKRQQGSNFASLNLFFSEHTVPRTEDDDHETITMYITEIEKGELPENAPVLLKKKIRLNTSRFSNMVNRRERLHGLMLSHLK